MCCQESGEREASVSLLCPKAGAGEPKLRRVKSFFFCSFFSLGGGGGSKFHFDSEFGRLVEVEFTTETSRQVIFFFKNGLIS